MGMKYKLITDEQKDLLSVVAEFGKNTVIPISAECDQKNIFPMEAYQEAFNIGLHMLDMPEELGGAGVGAGLGAGLAAAGGA